MTFDLEQLFSLTPELLSYVVPGYLFICIIQKIGCLKIDALNCWVWSVVISYTTIAILETIVAIFNRYFRFWELVVWCIVVDIALGALFSLAWNSEKLRVFVKENFRATLFDGALQNAIDWDEASYVCVYLKSEDLYYTGNIVMIDDNEDGWITISAPIVRNLSNDIVASNADDLNVVMAIPMKDVKRIKIVN